MTLEEKLDNFYENSMETARNAAEHIITEHQTALDKIFNEHKETLDRQAAEELKAEKEKVHREINKQLSTASLHTKRSLSKKSSELKEKLMAEVLEKLRAFKQTPEYPLYLKRKITEALAFAGSDDIVLYLDPSDAPLRESLEQSANVRLSLSDETFEGGIRALIPEKHILIDNSFLTMLLEEQEAFSFQGGIAHE